MMLGKIRWTKRDETMTDQEYEKERIRRLQEHADRINASVVPERPGIVRTDGDRRQFIAEVRNGILHLTEI